MTKQAKGLRERTNREATQVFHQSGGHAAGALARIGVMAGHLEDDEDAGELLLTVRSVITNLKHDNIADAIRVVLDSQAWRSYTYPSGEHYEFLPREFDYFLAQQDIDPRMVKDAALYTNDAELRVLLVESSLDKPGDDRRNVDEITAAYPALTRWLDKYGLRALGTTLLYESPTARAKTKKGAGGNEAANRRDWTVAVFGDGSLAEAIVRKLTRDPVLAEEVRDLLVRDVATSRTCSSCGGPLTGKQTYCSDTCSKRARRARRAS